MVLNKTLQIINNKQYVKKQVQILCNIYQLPCVNIKYASLRKADAIAELENNTIVFNIDLLSGDGIYEYLNTQDIMIVLKSTIFHEIEHLKQYYEHIKTLKNPTGLGSNNLIIKNKTNYPYQYMSLYIKGSQNNFLRAVYILQPNEYQAFQKGIVALKESLQESETEKFKNRLCIIDNAISFLR